MEVIYIEHPVQLNQKWLPSSVAFGTFDGVHQGHQQVIKKAVQIAQESDLRAGVMTFYPHPKEVLGKVTTKQRLTPLDDKIKYIESLGIDFMLIIKFNDLFSKLSPEQFIEQYIVQLQIKHVITGFDFCFGHQGKGTIETLSLWSEKTNDFLVHVVPSIDQNNKKISSSRIRDLLGTGQLQEVTLLLQRNYSITGTVVHGEKRGRTIGFPTANIELSAPYFLPKTGVYAALVYWGEQRYKSVMNLGVKPTFQKSEHPTIEAHLFDFSGDLYDQEVKVEFIEYLREEQRFSSLEALKEQISKDAKAALEKLNHIF